MTIPIGPLNQVPLACTLTPAAGREQVQRWRSFDREHAVRREESPTALTVHYARTSHAVETLHQLVNAESACCSFVDWRIEDHGTQLTLVVSGSPDQLAALSINGPRAERA